MSHTGFEIDLYGTQKLSQDKIVRVVKALPAPMQVSASLNSGNIHVIKGSLKSYISLQEPSKQNIIDFFSDWVVYEALDTADLYYGRGELKKGVINVWFAPSLSESAGEIYGKTNIAKELKKKNMRNWKHVFSIAQGGGDESELDRRVFDYGKIVAETFISEDEEEKYTLILSDFNENISIVSKKEFLGQLEKLISENCAGG